MTTATTAEELLAHERAESKKRADAIRDMMPKYMQLWAPLDAVREVCKERLQFSDKILSLINERDAALKRVAELEDAFIESLDAAIPGAAPWTHAPSEKATYAAKILPSQLAGLGRIRTSLKQQCDAAIKRAEEAEAKLAATNS